MIVDKTNYKYSVPLQQPNQKISKKQSFTGSMGKQITELLPQKKAINFMEKLKWFDGEHGRILMTALGTGAIAPLFIAWNPYVKAKPNATQKEKEDLENTKKYTAMRQPVSAVLQIILQLSLLTPLYKGLDAVFNNPENSKYIWKDLDKSALQDDKYVQGQVKKELKASKTNFSNKEEFQKEVEKQTKKRINGQIEQVANKLQKTGQIHIGARTIDDKVTAEILNSTIDDYIKATEELRVNNNGMDFYKQRATTLINNKKELTNILSNIPEKDSEITSYLQQHLSKTKSKGVKTIIKEIIDYPENLRASRSQRTLERIAKIEDMCGGVGKFTPEKYLDAMRKDYDMLTDVIEKLKGAKIENVANATPEQVKEVVGKVAQMCKYDKENSRVFGNTSTFDTSVEKLTKKIFKDITKGYKGVVGKKYRAFKEVAGITVGLFITTPITCTALNWVYPRFMEIFFPKLTGNQKVKEKAKLAALEKNGGEK